MAGPDEHDIHQLMDDRVRLELPSGALGRARGIVESVTPNLFTAMVLIDGSDVAVPVAYPALPVALVEGDDVVILRSRDGWMLLTEVLGRGDVLSANGILFPVTQVPSDDVNTLDDYEEGTWTPVLTFATPGNLSVVYSAQNGSYTKIGNRVFVVANMVTTTFTHTTASGALLVTGLPFTAGETAGCSGFLTRHSVAAGTYVVPFVQGAAAYCQFQAMVDGGASVGITTAHMPTGTLPTVRIEGHYRV